MSTVVQQRSLPNVEISTELISKISDKILPEATAWQNRPLEPVYLFIFMDATQGLPQRSQGTAKLKNNHLHVTKAACVVLRITMEVRKDILGICVDGHDFNIGLAAYPSYSGRIMLCCNDPCT